MSGHDNRSRIFSLLLLDVSLETTANKTGSSGGDQTNLLTVRGITSDCAGVTNVLLVTTTMGMINWIHSNTSNSWESLVLGLALPVGVGCL
jgi:hypothetical protein